MTPRARAPAYGKPLLEARRAGVHPSHIAVIYGRDWAMPAPGVMPRVVCLATKPGAALGLDWACCVGVPVTVFDRAASQMGGELWAMAAEIARHSPHVEIDGYDLIDGMPGTDIAYIAWACRSIDPAARKCAWPAWWSEEVAKIHEDKSTRWHHAREKRAGRAAEFAR